MWAAAAPAPTQVGQGWVGPCINVAPGRGWQPVKGSRGELQLSLAYTCLVACQALEELHGGHRALDLSCQHSLDAHSRVLLPPLSLHWTSASGTCHKQMTCPVSWPVR